MVKHAGQVMGVYLEKEKQTERKQSLLSELHNRKQRKIKRKTEKSRICQMKAIGGTIGYRRDQ